MSKRKKNKKRKGFTLLELVAVIIILGIIATIAIGRITTKMDEVRQSAYKTSVVNIIKAAENYAAQNLFRDPQPDYPIVFTCDSHECTNGSDSLSFKGDVPVSGTLSIDKDHRVTVSYLSNGKYCTSGVKTDLQVGKTCADIDITKPTLTATLEGKTINLTYNDNVGVTEYCVTTTDNPNACNWKNIEQSHELQEQGTYYVYVRDAKNNISDPIEIEAPSTAFCAFEIGHEWSDFAVGSSQEWEAPCNGLYKLEVWGAGSGCGQGGHSEGYKTYEIGDKLYVTIGGAGSGTTGGYNGGGTGGDYAGGAGGASHMAYVSGTLASIGKATFDANGLLVAGGAGGGSGNWAVGGWCSSGGGAGGGTTGGTGGKNTSYESPNGSPGTGGTQTAGAAFGRGGNGGQGPFRAYKGAGGGGYYGGYAASSSDGYASVGGGGGSGWIGGVPEITYKGITYSPLTTVGGNSGNGKAKITLIAY